MKEDILRAEINMSKIPGGGNVAGAIFAIGSSSSDTPAFVVSRADAVACDAGAP